MMGFFKPEEEVKAAKEAYDKYATPEEVTTYVNAERKAMSGDDQEQQRYQGL